MHYSRPLGRAEFPLHLINNVSVISFFSKQLMLVLLGLAKIALVICPISLVKFKFKLIYMTLSILDSYGLNMLQTV
jgi:hypothetical protein